ncbi:MAG: sigma-70 family RNA polymerase sigma factor [Fimbriimonadia bacterium]|nr:sigma-70 family RNA polymerase sigma factor [Fimbriimonadia bacterium]
MCRHRALTAWSLLSEQRIDVLLAIERLEPSQREVVRLRYFDDCTVRETARKMGLPVKSVAKMEKEALALLKMLLE